jgi:hypothetical protein
VIDYQINLANLSTGAGLGSVILTDFLMTTGTFAESELTYTNELNGWGSLEFSLPLDHAIVTRDNFKLGAREVHLYRNGTLVWGGKLWKASVSEWEVRFLCYGWGFDLERRILTADYAQNSKDQFGIVRDLIGETSPGTQSLTNGDLGIRFWSNSEVSSAPARRFVVCYDERRTVADALNELAAPRNGFDWEISPDKIMTLYSPQKGSTTTVAAVGADNIDDFSYEEDATEMLTDVGAVGPSDQCAIPDLYVTYDGTARTTYGRLEGTADDATDIEDKDRREKMADRMLQASKEPLFQPSISFSTDLQAVADDAVGFNELALGDTMTVETTRGQVGGYGYVNKGFRVINRQVTVSIPGVEHVQYGLDAVVTN